MHYLAVVPFPVEHPNCHFHRFPWPESRTSGYVFWGCFHLLAPPMLLWLGFKYKVNRLFAFGHTYSLFLQPLRLIKRVPLTLFLRADTVRNHEINERSNWLTTLELALEGLGIAGTRTYAVSKTLKDAVIERHRILKPALTGVLRNEIPIPPTGAVKQTRNIHSPLRAACVGVLESRKNQRFLLDVFKRINAEQAQLYLYGTGPDEQLLRERVQQENLTNRVHFMGWVPSENIWPEIDLLLMPSLHEGAPNAVLEALGWGVPVLASDIPEHAEILPQEILFPIAQIIRWRRKIIFLNDDPTVGLQQVISQQRFYVKALQFDWENAFTRCAAQIIEDIDQQLY